MSNRLWHLGQISESSACASMMINDGQHRPTLWDMRSCRVKFYKPRSQGSNEMNIWFQIWRRSSIKVWIHNFESIYLTNK